MKRVIDGKVFNTETAARIGVWEHGTSGDHHYVYEALFKSPRGKFFIEYDGGALSRYAVSEGPNTIGGSSGIRLLDESEALAWCEEHQLEADVIQKYFELEDG